MRKERKQERRLFVLIIIIILLLATLAVVTYKLLQPTATAVILPAREEAHDADATGTIRISVEPSVTIRDGTMQNLNFFNTNKNRLMSIKIYTQDGDEIKELVYTSPKIETGMAIVGDFIDTSKLKRGTNKATVEVYYYDLEEKIIGRTNVKDISLIYES